MKKPLRERIRQLLGAAKGFWGRGGRRRVPRAATARARHFVDRIVSDAILFNETAYVPDRAARRTDFLAAKLREFGYPDPRVDGQGGISVTVPGSAGADAAVLVFADAGFPADAGAECIVTLGADRAEGRGLAEDSVGVAALLVLAEHLAEAEPPLARDLVLYFLPCGGGDQRELPLERFIRGSGCPFALAVHLRSVPLGRIEERPLGACRLRVRVRTGEKEVATAAGGASAISVLAAIASRLGSIRWDSEGSTFLNIARLEAGAGFGWHASEGMLELEIMSTEAAALEVARKAVTATIQTTAAESGASVEVATASLYPPGRMEINAGLTAALRRVYARLRIRAVPVSIPDQSAVASALGIPAVSLGMTTGRKTLTEEWVDIPPIETGFRQLLAFLEEAARAGQGEGRGG
jgi:tripeptide aminopeptidase